MSEVHSIKNMRDVRTNRDIWRRRRASGLSDVNHRQDDKRPAFSLPAKEMRIERGRFLSQSKAVSEARQKMLDVRQGLHEAYEKNAALSQFRKVLDRERAASEAPWRWGIGPAAMPKRRLGAWH